MKKSFRISLITLFLLVSVNFMAFAETVDPSAQNAGHFGVWTLIPPLVAIILAFITKNVVISLFVGIFTGTFMLSLQNGNVFAALFNGFISLMDRILSSLADPWNAGIILQCFAIGGLVAVISRMGGAKAVAEKLAKRAKSPVSAQILTCILGILVFFDDYANSLIIGPVMRPVTDKLRISREKLSFVIDATAAPIAGLAIISTWIGAEISYIKDGFDAIGQNVNAYSVFLETIPYRFYNFLIIAFIIFTAIFLKEFGPMRKAELRARKYGKVLDDDAVPMASSESDELEPKEGVKPSLSTALVPIGLLIVTALVGFYFNGYNTIMGGDDETIKSLLKTSPVAINSIIQAFGASDASVVLFQSSLFASIVAIIMAVAKKACTLNEAIETWIGGIKSLIVTGVILLLAWSLSSTVKEVGTAKYIVNVFSQFHNTEAIKPFVPAIIFILGSIISFATGTSYGTMAILMPLAIPLAHTIGTDHSYIIMSAGAVLTGAIFGDHCSPISDTSILSSMGSSCDHMAHVRTQLWYALTVAAITVLFGYLPVGFGVPVYIVLPIAVILTGCTVYFFGKSVDVPVEEQENLENEDLEEIV